MNYGKGAIIFMRYISTRGGLEEKLSAEAIKQGLAADGGLFVPDTIPELSMTEIQELVNMVCDPGSADFVKVSYRLYL